MFIDSVAGEQYALPEIIPLLRMAAGDLPEPPLILPATDPLNFTGRFNSAPRVPALPARSVVIDRGEVRGHEAVR